ncbi:arsenosugar biosynthesis radical SAM (seleno)protein ArsS [Thiolapillus sp.]|uniref:arsenosugar biosynthesis radical SAM (seleno)protein ArsS n=3 Tax=Thiolapillus sp. TaxID=2017437 RepID=UPI0025DB3854|nr:arsenosugar biosynthesis radical SAM (seleno)protein ArsS [Thiolapillus sp.]
MHATLPLLKETDFPPLVRNNLTTLQVDLGYRCNQSCLHCHVNASPRRPEQMARETVELVLEVLQRQKLRTLDLTGGAPELNPHFRYLVSEATRLGVQVIDRCNLTILQEPGQEDLADFLAEQGVEITASLPCYLPENVDAQRGKGVYQDSLAGLRQLNARGYGSDPRRVLNLVYNPGGPSLPPPQQLLEQDYRKRLGERGIVFNRLFTITNMPIKRFGSTLISKGIFQDYMQTLRGAHQADNLAGVMCRSLISVDWQGRLYDCDFNQMLDMPLTLPHSSRPLLQDLLKQDMEGRPIGIADHCYGCTAGQGSSCGGALDS